MGKIRTKLIGLEEVEEKQKRDAKVRREEKKKREGIKVRPTGGKGGERMKQVDVDEEALKKMERTKQILEKTSTEPKKAPPSPIKQRKTRGKKYQLARKRVDKSKTYNIKEAVALLKKIKISRFDETVELHINTRESNIKGEIQLPHGTGKEVKVTIIDDKVLAEIEKGNINFDVLICHPSYMPKLAKLAKLLGPKGLMPNPKTGTISDKPEEAAKKFAGGLIRFKTEAKIPIIHQAVGKLSFKDEALMENITAFINVVGKSKIESVYLKSSMSPSIRLDIEKV
jgi:large subunit ribosomal protein L1